MNKNPKAILHLIPISSLVSLQNYDIDKIYTARTLIPMYCMGWDTRYNLDGILSFALGKESIAHSYVQLYSSMLKTPTVRSRDEAIPASTIEVLPYYRIGVKDAGQTKFVKVNTPAVRPWEVYRNGIIEAVETSLLGPSYSGKKKIPIVSFEQKFIESLTQYISLIKELNVPTPIHVSVTLTGIKGYSMNVGENYFGREIYPIDRDILTTTENIIEDFNVRVDTVLKPCFDSIWNACGCPKSLNYTDAGEWKPSR